MENKHIETASSIESDLYEEKDGDGGPGLRTLYSPEVIAEIKQNISIIWDREKKYQKKTQEDLAKRLGISQSAVSKLLNNTDSHPWTVDKIEKFIDFCNADLTDIVKDKSLIGYFDNWRGDGVPLSEKRIEEAKTALKSFLGEHGRDLSETKLYELAGKLATRVSNSNRSTEEYAKQIMQLLISEL